MDVEGTRVNLRERFNKRVGCISRRCVSIRQAKSLDMWREVDDSEQRVRVSHSLGAKIIFVVFYSEEPDVRPN